MHITLTQKFCSQLDIAQMSAHQALLNLQNRGRTMTGRALVFGFALNLAKLTNLKVESFIVRIIKAHHLTYFSDATKSYAYN